MKIIHSLILFAVVLCTACGTKTDTTTVRSANGEVTTTLNEGPYSKDTRTVINTRSGYMDCMSTQAPAMGTSNADIFCRNITSGGVTPGAYAGYGMGPMVGTTVPFMGYPGSAPVILPSNMPPAALATQIASGSHGSAVVEIRSNQAVDDRMAKIEEDNNDLAKAMKVEREKRRKAEDELKRLQEKKPATDKKGSTKTPTKPTTTAPSVPQTRGTALDDAPQINVSAASANYTPADNNP